MHLTSRILCGLVLAEAVLVSYAGAREKVSNYEKPSIDAKKAKEFFKTQQMVDQQGVDYSDRMIRMFGKRELYSPAQLAAVLDPDIVVTHPSPPQAKVQKKDALTGRIPKDTFATSSLDTRYEVMEALEPGSKAAKERLFQLGGTGVQDYYRADQVRYAEKGPGGPPPTGEALAKINAANAERIKAEEHVRDTPEGIHLRIRRDWRDMLYDEDRSQLENANKTLGDLSGAQFSYAYNGVTKADTWSVQGAVVLPWVYYRTKPTTDFTLRAVGLAPSVTFNRVTSNGNEAAEQNTVFSRVGIYLDFLGEAGKSGKPLGIQIRAAGVQVNDFTGNGDLRGYELDLEPRVLFGKRVALGYKRSMVDKFDLKPDHSDTTWMEYQLRAWLHVEGGNAQDTSAGWNTTKGDFCRIGPSVEAKLNWPHLSGDRGASLTALYSYRFALSGPEGHNWYFSSTFAYDLYHNAALKRKIALSANYERGGLTFTTQKVDQLTLGLSVLF